MCQCRSCPTCVHLVSLNLPLQSSSQCDIICRLSTEDSPGTTSLYLTTQRWGWYTFPSSLEVVRKTSRPGAMHTLCVVTTKKIVKLFNFRVQRSNQYPLRIDGDFCILNLKGVVGFLGVDNIVSFIINFPTKIHWVESTELFWLSLGIFLFFYIKNVYFR